MRNLLLFDPSKAKQSKTTSNFHPTLQAEEAQDALFLHNQSARKGFCAKRTSNGSIITSFLSLCAF